MDRHVNYYYNSDSDIGSGSYFHQVVALHQAPDLTWERAHRICEELPSGWFELVQLPQGDRLDFLHATWLRLLPFRTHLKSCVASFFERLDDVGVFLVRRRYGDPFQAEMVYSLADDGGFYRGHVPTREERLTTLAAQFPKWTFPNDYLAFLSVHDGFAKWADSGIIPSEDVKNVYERVQESIGRQSSPLVDASGDLVNPQTLIPFYESFSMPYYQCFWADWYPQSQMGNVYYSAVDETISNCDDPDTWLENMAFPTFMDWLAFYLEPPISQ